MTMKGRRKLPKGLFYRKRRDGTWSEVIWCWYYVPGKHQPEKETTSTTDLEEAKRYRAARLAEHPTARRERKMTEAVTVSEALDLLQADAGDHGRMVHRALWCGLRYRLGHLKLLDLTRAHLDDLARTWIREGITYPERDLVRNPQHPVSGPTCNRGMAMLRRARTLAMDKLGITLPRLTFPHFGEPVKGKYIPPSDFYMILANIGDLVKAAFMELAYLTGVRKGQLRKTELRNVRVEYGKTTALVWEADKVKTRQPHEVPLEGRAQEIVQKLYDDLHIIDDPRVVVLRRPPTTLLFQSKARPLGELKSEWRTACQKAGLPWGRKHDGYVFHNTRHSCLTNLAADGVPDTVARSISGHRTPSVHARYQITQESAKRAA